MKVQMPNFSSLLPVVFFNTFKIQKKVTSFADTTCKNFSTFALSKLQSCRFGGVKESVLAIELKVCGLKTGQGH
jgi:hypothetical protein